MSEDVHINGCFSPDFPVHSEEDQPPPLPMRKHMQSTPVNGHTAQSTEEFPPPVPLKQSQGKGPFPSPTHTPIMQPVDSTSSTDRLLSNSVDSGGFLDQLPHVPVRIESIPGLKSALVQETPSPKSPHTDRPSSSEMPSATSHTPHWDEVISEMRKYNEDLMKSSASPDAKPPVPLKKRTVLMYNFMVHNYTFDDRLLEPLYISKEEPPPPPLPPKRRRAMPVSKTDEDHSEPKFLLTELESLKEKICPIILHIQQADETTKNAVQLFTKQVVLVLHTCNQDEYWAALERLEPPTKEDGNKIQDRSIQYQQSGSVLGWFAGYRAAVVRTEQGEKGCNNLETAIIESFPNAQVIIGTGIAYSNRKHKFADVLISNQVEFIAQHTKEGDEITNQGSRQEIGPDVKEVFEDSARNWSDMGSFTCTDNNRTSVVHIGCIVSAPTLEMLRGQLLTVSNSIGGEIEGWVLFELKKTLKDNRNKDLQVIIIKGVADYGDLRMGDKWEWTAAKAAMDCIHYCLEKSGGTEFNANDIAKKAAQEAQEARVEQHVQAYQRALKEGAAIPLKYLKVLFIGPPRTGKTSMRRRLIGEIVNLKGKPNQISTGTAEGCDVLLKRVEEPVQCQESTCTAKGYDATVKLSEEKTTTSTNVITEPTKWLSINKIGGKKAHETDLNEEIRLLCKFVYKTSPKENMSGVSSLENSESESEPLEDNGILKENRPSSESRSSDPPSKNMSYVEEAQDKTAKDHSKTEKDTVPGSTLVEPSKTTEINPSTLSSHKTSVGMQGYGFSAEQMEEIKKKFKLDTEQMKEIKQAFEDFDNALHTPGQDNFNILVLMNMVDTGGQPAFVEMLPALTIGSALYLIFFRLDQELKDGYSIKYLNENNEEVELGDSSYTVQEVISQALSSIACFSCTAFNMPSSKIMQYESCVAAVLMGTHKDKLEHNPNAEIKTKDHALQKVTAIFNSGTEFLYPAETETNQLIFAIDNMEGDEKELEKVRKRLEEIIEHKFVSKPIPVSWLMFGILLRKMGKRTMLLSQCHAIGKLASVPDQELDAALWFLHHHVGIVMHFPEAGIKDIVICDPQVVFDSVTDLISKSFTREKVLCMKSQCHTFRDTGQFKLNDLQKLEVTTLPRAELVKLLEYLNIIAPIKSDKSSKQSEELIYFMPAVLEHAKDGELHMEQHARDPVPLMIRFKCGFVPVGVFCAMIASLVAQKDTWKLHKREGHSMYKNKVAFRVNGTFDVTLISKVKRYEIHIARMSTNEFQLEKMCRHALETVCDTLDQVTSRMKFKPDCSTPNKSLYELGFKCPEHPDDDHLVINRSTDLEKNTREEESLSAKSLWFEGKSTMICLEEDESIDFAETRSYAQQSLVWFGKATKISSALPASLPDKATEKAIKLFATQVVLILHTCKPKEFWAVLDKLKPPTKEDDSKIQDCPIIYPQGDSVIGWFGGYRAAVVRTRQGSGCCVDLTKALTESFPNGQVIIAAGIAFTNDQRRKFADVLISDEVENFVQYIMAGNEITNHGRREKIDPNLQSVFVNPARDWTDKRCFKCADDNRTSVAHIGCIVSAPELVKKDEVQRDQLMKHTPDAIGGEMIGCILFELKKTLEVQHKKDIQVIVIKGVADYGDLRMGGKWEWTAAEAAVECIHYCLMKSGGIEFSANDIVKRVAQKAKVDPSKVTQNPESFNEMNILNVLHEAGFADAHWELLGEQLIKHTAVLTIRANHHGECSHCMIDALSQWLRTDIETSWEKLAEAVAKVEQYGEATAERVRLKAGIVHTGVRHAQLPERKRERTDLESEPSYVAPIPKRAPTAAEQSPAEEAQVELTIDDHPEVTDYLLDLTQTDIHNLGITLGLYHRRLKSMRDSDTFRDDMIDAWLQKEDQATKHGVPTWETLVKALKHCRVNQIEVAKRIEADKLSITK